MSLAAPAGNLMTLDEARLEAAMVVESLGFYCSRIEVAGSVRRERPYPRDIEVVCIVEPRHIREFKETVDRLEKIRGEATGRYTRRRLPSGAELDLFMVRPENWGLQFAIRTGSADFSHRVLACGWVKAGYKSEDGMLHRNGIPVPVYEERDLFKLIGFPWLEPRDR